MTFPGGLPFIRQKKIQTQALDVSGNGSVRITNNNSGVQWIVEQVSNVTNPRKDGCTAELYESGDFVDTNYFAGTGDTATGPPFLYLDSGEYVECIYSNGPPSGQAVMTIRYMEVQRGGASGVQ